MSSSGKIEQVAALDQMLPNAMRNQKHKETRCAGSASVQKRDLHAGGETSIARISSSAPERRMRGMLVLHDKGSNSA